MRAPEIKPNPLEDLETKIQVHTEAAERRMHLLKRPARLKTGHRHTAASRGGSERASERTRETRSQLLGDLRLPPPYAGHGEAIESAPDPSLQGSRLHISQQNKTLVGSACDPIAPPSLPQTTQKSTRVVFDASTASPLLPQQKRPNRESSASSSLPPYQKPCCRSTPQCKAYPRLQGSHSTDPEAAPPGLLSAVRAFG